ncbi:MAG: hypothetical protein IJE12_08520 [Prevotella sp.]|nr:hypothetical protein [Prevotella sp.]
MKRNLMKFVIAFMALMAPLFQQYVNAEELKIVIKNNVNNDNAFTGDVDNLNITFSYTLKVTMSTGIQHFIVSGDYSECAGFCSASFREYTPTNDEEDEEG